MALVREEFQLYYQPIFKMSDRSLVGSEALVRWNHPAHGVLLPSQFIPSIQYTSEMLELEEWVIERAVQKVCTTISSQYIAVNVSSKMFYRPDFVSWIENKILKRFDVQDGALQFDVNEEVIMINPRTSKKIIMQLHELGVVVAVDDFGTGCSCLGKLKDVPLRSLKIDGQFISPLVGCSSSRRLCEAIIAAGHCLGMEVVAEGIETEEEYQFLKQAGCDRGQGHLLGTPKP